jgi:RND family efflux transporter MFP subunit
MKTAMKLLVIIAVLPFFISACGSKEKQGPVGKTVSAQTITAGKEKVLLTRRFPGQVEAKNEIVLSSKISGAVTALFVEEGDQVIKGARLITVDDRELKKKMEALRAELDGAQRGRESVAAQTAYAEANFKRFSQLIKEAAATREEYDRARAEYESKAKQELTFSAQEKAIKAQMGELKALQSYAEITSPVGGVVIKRYVDRGAFVNAGQPLIALNDEAAGFWFVARIDESLMKHDQEKPLVQISLPSMGIDLMTAVSTLVPHVDTATRTFTVKADITGQKVRSGVYGALYWPLGEAETLLIPAPAIIRRGDLTAVYVTGSDRVIHFRLITTGTYFKTSKPQDKGLFTPVESAPEKNEDTGKDLWIEVLSGLSPQEIIVVSDVQTVSEGDVLK